MVYYFGDITILAGITMCILHHLTVTTEMGQLCRTLPHVSCCSLVSLPIPKTRLQSSWNSNKTGLNGSSRCFYEPTVRSAQAQSYKKKKTRREQQSISTKTGQRIFGQQLFCHKHGKQNNV